MPFSLLGVRLQQQQQQKLLIFFFSKKKSTKVGASEVSYRLKPLLCVSLMTCKFDPRNYIKVEGENSVHKAVL